MGLLVCRSVCVGWVDYSSKEGGRIMESLSGGALGRGRGEEDDGVSLCALLSIDFKNFAYRISKYSESLS
jgi:hypothetical protein